MLAKYLNWIVLLHPAQNKPEVVKLRVAIMGCGMAGMSAAILLQNKRIDFDIYDSNSDVGDFPVRAEIMLPVYSRPVWNLPKFIRERYGIVFKPYVAARKIIFHSPGTKAEAKGKLGHVFIRGRADQSIDRQLYRQLSVKVNWNSPVETDDLLADYNWVIDARGCSPKDAPGSQPYLIKGGLIRGHFQPGVNHMLHDSLGSPGGYGYLTPITQSIASLVVIVPKERVMGARDFFKDFWFFMCRNLGYEPQLLRPEQFERRLARGPAPLTERVLPVGNCLGSATPFLGMDPLTAFATAYYAVKEISGEPGYWEAVQNLSGHLKRMHTIQAGMGRWGDGAYAFLLRLMAIGATPYFNSRVNLLSATSRVLKPFV